MAKHFRLQAFLLTALLLSTAPAQALLNEPAPLLKTKGRTPSEKATEARPMMIEAARLTDSTRESAALC